MLKAYKYRICPTSEQKISFQKHFDACRFIYNLALETKIYTYKSLGKNTTYFDLSAQLTELKKDCFWLKDVGRHSLESSIKDMIFSFDKFFKGAGYPKFKSKYDKQSFCSRQSNSINSGKLDISKIKSIPIVLSRTFEGTIKAVTISKTPTGKYFASILVDNGSEIPMPPKPELSKTIGVDLGLKYFAITSEGVKFENPRHLKTAIERLRILQRRASKKKKGSANRKKANLRVAIFHEKITNKRTDFLHKLSTKLVYDNQATTFCMETLTVKNMVKNHSLAQAISDASWSEFVRQMNYKCVCSGKNLIQIGRFDPSSKNCSDCGNKNETLVLSDREWVCKSCGSVHDRDINAAINIKNSGLDKSGESVELLPIGRAKKQKLHTVEVDLKVLKESI